MLNLWLFVYLKEGVNGNSNKKIVWKFKIICENVCCAHK